MIQSMFDAIETQITGAVVQVGESAEEHARELSWLAVRIKGLASGTSNSIATLADLLQQEILNSYASAVEIGRQIEGPLRQTVHSAEAATSKALGYEVHSLTDPAVREAVWSLTGGKCTYCGCQLSKSWREDRANPESVSALYIEHVVPRSAGGPDNLANYVPSCHGCNTSKGSRHVMEFIQARLPVRLAVVPKQEGAA